MTYYCYGCRRGDCRICVRYVNPGKPCECEGGYHKLKPSLEKQPQNLRIPTKKNLEDKIQELEGKLIKLNELSGGRKIGTLPKGFSGVDYIEQANRRLSKHYEVKTNNYTRSGTLPKGFRRSVLSTIMLRSKQEIKRLYDQEKCLGCETSVKIDNEKHYVFCKKCTDELQMSPMSFKHAIKRFKKYGVKDKKKQPPFTKRLMLKLKLAEKTEVKNEV